MVDTALDSTVSNIHFIHMLGVRVDIMDSNELIGRITGTINSANRVLVSYVNAHAMNLAYDVSWFRDYLNQSDIVFCDGFGVKWAARFFFKTRLPRLTPPDWFPRLFEICAQNQYSLFFLGARPGVAQLAANRYCQKFPVLQMAGIQHGYFDKTAGSSENEAVISLINQVKPDILVIGFGMPLQERWLLENWDRLDAKVAIPIGAGFDYLAGVTPRAPRWMTDHGLEWLGRLIIEPRRLWKRYLIGNPLFFYRLIKYKLALIGEKVEAASDR